VPHGAGKMRTPDGKVMEGNWIHGDLEAPDAMPNKT
jgi:hypothetical protein